MRMSGIISFVSLYWAFHNIDLAIYLMLFSISWRMSEDASSICEFLKMLMVSSNREKEDE